MDVAGNQLIDPGVFVFDTTDFSLPNQAPTLHVFTIGTPTLSWTHLSWAISYEVEIDTDKTFALPRPTGYSTPLPATTTSLTLPTALPDGTYYFRVRGKSATGATGAYSAAEPFAIVSG
jgi:hypothetical protein